MTPESQATTRSELPSPVRSPTATAAGPAAVGWLTAEWNENLVAS